MASGDTLLTFEPTDFRPPVSNYATPDQRNGIPVLDFDGATDEEAIAHSILPLHYAGGGLTLRLIVALTSATSGTVRMQAAIERHQASTTDLDADDFAAFQSGGVSVPGTSGHTVAIDIAFTNGAQMDSVAAGESFRLKIRRDADGTSGTDDVTTDLELVGASLKET